jgi:transglutaminase-like putative cysteine protease
MRDGVLTITHETTYRYEQPVERSRHMLRLRPVEDARQRLLDYSLCISVGGVAQEFEDIFGNQVAEVSVEQPFTELVIVSRSRVTVAPARPLVMPARRLTLPMFALPREQQVTLPYLLPPDLPDDELRALWDYAAGFAQRNDWDLIDTLVDLNTTIHGEFAYAPGTTTVDTTPYEVFCTRRGVCQDFTNLFICLARLLGVPARYRMGYMHAGGGPATESEKATHAWGELYISGLGWRGFDPTHGHLAGAGHVRIACGRAARDATPTSGTIFAGGGREVLSVMVQVEEAA